MEVTETNQSSPHSLPRAESATDTAGHCKDPAGDTVRNSFQNCKDSVEKLGNGSDSAVDKTGNCNNSLVDENCTDSAADKVRNCTDSAADKVGNCTDSAADKVGNCTDSAADKVGNCTDSSADKVGNCTDSAADKVGNSTDSAEDKVGNCTDSAADTDGNCNVTATDKVGNSQDSAADKVEKCNKLGVTDTMKNCTAETVESCMEPSASNGQPCNKTESETVLDNGINQDNSAEKPPLKEAAPAQNGLDSGGSGCLPDSDIVREKLSTTDVHVHVHEPADVPPVLQKDIAPSLVTDELQPCVAATTSTSKIPVMGDDQRAAAVSSEPALVENAVALTVVTPSESSRMSGCESSLSPGKVSPGTVVAPVGRMGPRAKMTLSPPCGFSGARPAVARKSCARKTMGCSSPKSARHFTDIVTYPSLYKQEDKQQGSSGRTLNNKVSLGADQDGDGKCTQIGGIFIKQDENVPPASPRDPSKESRAKSVPKARKSFHPKNRQSRSEDRDSSETDAAPPSALPIASMTFRLPEIESALGIKRKALDKMDAKTLDKFVLQKVKKSRTLAASAESKNAGITSIDHSHAQFNTVKNPSMKSEPAETNTSLGLPVLTAADSSCGVNLATVITGQKLLLKKKKKKRPERLGRYKLPGEKKYKKQEGKLGESLKAANAVRKMRSKNKGDLANDSWLDVEGEEPVSDSSCQQNMQIESSNSSVQSSVLRSLLRSPKKLSALARQHLSQSQAAELGYSDQERQPKKKKKKVSKKYSRCSWAKGDVLTWKQKQLMRKRKLEKMEAAAAAAAAQGLDGQTPLVQGTITSLFKRQRQSQTARSASSTTESPMLRRVLGEPPIITPSLSELSIDTSGESAIGLRRSNRKRKAIPLDFDDSSSVVSTPTSQPDSDISLFGQALKRRKLDPEDSDQGLPTLSRADTPTSQAVVSSGSTPSPPNISPHKAHTIQPGTSLLKKNWVLSEAGLKYGNRASSEDEHLLAAAAPSSGAATLQVEGSASAQAARFINTPNGITYPVTPPKTPDSGGTTDERQGSSSAATARRDNDLIPLCCCKVAVPIANKTKHVVYCQALDSTDGKIGGCCSQVATMQHVRPSMKIPFMVVCEMHRKRMQLHQCCPGCGHFCTQGKFFQCSKRLSSGGIHLYHRQCQVFREDKYFCPHCGEESLQQEVTLQLVEPRASSFFVKDDKFRITGPRAKMSANQRVPPLEQGLADQSAEDALQVSIQVNKKKISTGDLPLGPKRSELEAAIALLEGDKPKKLRAAPKNLYSAARQGDLERVLYLLMDGLDPNVQYEEQFNETALHAASGAGHFIVVYVLIQAGGSPHSISSSLRTPIMEAGAGGHTEVVQYLLKSGAIVDTKGEDGMTCLHLAAKCGKVNTVQYIIESCKIDVNITDDGGWTPVIWAAEHRHLDTVKYLLSVGADPNLRDSEENTGLHWSSYSGSVDIAEMFLNAGCDLEAANEHGDRPLHIAARQDHYECVVLFLARGGDSEARNNENQAPIACCLEQSSPCWMALRVNKQLKGIAARRLQSADHLLHRDLSLGRENNPVPVVNGVDSENYPQDYQYVTDCVETAPMNVNRVITSLQHCLCKDNCQSMFCSCSRSSVRCWFDKEGKLSKDFNYLDPPLIFECNKACRCWANCQNRVIQLGITVRLQVFRTLGRGWGCRTLLDIPQGSFVCEYIGELICDAEADSREDDSYLFDLDNKDTDTNCIDARRYGNVSRFINHLCEPNVIPVKVFVDHQDLRFPRICFFANRDIKAFEELGFDYGEKFWIIKWKQFTCTCGSPKCRYSSETIQRTLDEYHSRQEMEAMDDS